MFRESERWGDRPDEVEVAQTCVFVRREFEQIEQEEDGKATGVTGWKYQEAKMTPAEYAAHVAEQVQSDLLDVQEAVAEMYEAVIGD